MLGLRLIKDSIIQETISGFNKRWEELEAAQAGLKQNLVLYNNFVKEKQGKVADGVSIILIEKKKQKKVCIASPLSHYVLLSRFTKDSLRPSLEMVFLIVLSLNIN